MATSKKSSTSKTARVMNLLSKSHEETVETEVIATETASAAAPAAAPAVSAPPVEASHPTTPPLISSMQADSAISDQVLSALEDALDNELSDAKETTAAEQPAAEPTPEAVVENEPEIAAEAVNNAISEAITQVTEVEETVVEAAEASVIQPAAPAPAPADKKADDEEESHPPTRFTVDKSTIYVNVMESLVEDKAMKYINMFGLCKCPRCVADVKALTLNRLEPKYVVMQTGDVIPRITLYEGQFAAAVTAQLLTACKMVMEHPRHSR